MTRKKYQQTTVNPSLRAMHTVKQRQPSFMVDVVVPVAGYNVSALLAFAGLIALVTSDNALLGIGLILSGIISYVTLSWRLAEWDHNRVTEDSRREYVDKQPEPVRRAESVITHAAGQTIIYGPLKASQSDYLGLYNEVMRHRNKAFTRAAFVKYKCSYENIPLLWHRDNRTIQKDLLRLRWIDDETLDAPPATELGLDMLWRAATKGLLDDE